MSCNLKHFKKETPNPFQGVPWSIHPPRLCIALALCGVPSLLVSVLAVVCSSWTAVNLATSGRSVLLPGGRTYYKSVVSANKMVARTVLVWVGRSFQEIFWNMNIPRNFRLSKDKCWRWLRILLSIWGSLPSGPLFSSCSWQQCSALGWWRTRLGHLSLNIPEWSKPLKSYGDSESKYLDFEYSMTLIEGPLLIHLVKAMVSRFCGTS